MNENLWGINGFAEIEAESTSHIIEIMNDQCKYLSTFTNGKVFAVFGEIKLETPLVATISQIAKVINSSNISNIKVENVGNAKTGLLTDASSMFYETKYAFEIYTDIYKFRLFELIMTPSYPVDLIIDEGIYNSICNDLNDFESSKSTQYCYRIYNESKFCKIIKLILQNRKVQYIINRLEKIADEENSTINNNHNSRIILCEGQTDEIVLQAIAKKLNRTITTIVANGKNSIPTYLKEITNTNVQILIVVDSDGNEEKTRKALIDSIGSNYKIAIINNEIEDWFAIPKKDFSRIKLIQSIDELINQVDFKMLQAKDKSFNTVIQFINGE